jgi:Mg2+/Co2+ transporter CorB
METEILLSIGAIALLLVFSAFFSGSETALTAASRSRMHTLEQQGDPRARLVNELFARKERLIGAVLLGNNLVNITASALATSLMIGWAGDAGIAYATLVMTLLVLIFAEVLPKTYAIHNPDGFALSVSRSMRVVVRLFGPVTLAVQAVAILRVFAPQFPRLALRFRGVRRPLFPIPGG